MAVAQRNPVTDPPHIVVDAEGVAWLGNTNVKVVEVVIDSTSLQMSSSQIHAAHPELSLAQIHAALSYYFDHKAQIDSQISHREVKVGQYVASAKEQLTRAELEDRTRRRRAA